MSGPLRTAAAVCAAAVCTLVSAGYAMAQQPTAVRIEGVEENRHILSFVPEFCWDFAGAQTNWHLQVDDDPGFSPNFNNNPSGQMFFWDSGDQDKGARGSDRCARMREIIAPGYIPITLDRRAAVSYWRIRIQQSGVWGPWKSGKLRMNQYPMGARDLDVSFEPLSSTDPVVPLDPPVAGATYHVAPFGDDASPGTASAPFRTIQRATRALSAGDTLLLRAGVYEENVLVSASTGHASGKPGRPVTVAAYPGERPVLRAISTGTRTALEVGRELTDWVFDGLTVGGPSTRIGINISGARSVTVRDCRWEATVSTSMTGMILDGGAEDLRITGCLFDQPMFDQIEVRAARHVEIRGNEFTNFNTRHCVHAHGGSASNLVIADNHFHDGHPFEGVLFLYIGTQGTRIVNNVFRNILRADPSDPSDTGNAWAIVVLRSGEITVENNTFHGIDHEAIQLLEYSNFGRYRNNIFSDCAVGIRFRGGIQPGSATTGAVMDYNVFFGNGTDYVLDPAELAGFDHPPTGNCLGGPPPGDPSCDPDFVGAAAGDLQLGPASAAVDAGDPATPVPEGGGSRVDAGRFERGAGTPPYPYRPRIEVGDSTPRLTWKIFDVDNELERLFDDLPPGDTDFQTRFQLQIDPAPTFDSLSQGRPLIDSGEVASTVEGWTVPDGRALAPGAYYARVRQWDDHDFNKGAWSDHRFRFRIGPPEPFPPYIASISPQDGAQGVVENTIIEAHVRDDGVGVDLATIAMTVDGAQVTPDITGHPNDYRVAYAAPSGFSLDSTVTVRIVAEDIDRTPPGLDHTFSFKVRDLTPPSPPGHVRFK